MRARTGMLTALVRGALEHRRVVFALSVLLMAWGVWSASRARLDVLPDFAPPQVAVQTECPGFSAEAVERLVTRPIETQLLGSAGVEVMRSQSIQGLSIVNVVFADDADPFRARQALAEQLANVRGALPDAVATPRMTPLTSSTMDVLKIGLDSDAMTPADLRSFAQWNLRPRLLAVSGVSSVSLFGGEVERLEVQLLPERLEAYGLTLGEVADAVRRATGVRGAGFVEDANQRLVVETRGQSSTPAELARVVLQPRADRSVTIGDVARVVSGESPRFGDALVQGKPAVLITMLAQYGANSLDVTRGLERVIDEARPELAARGIVLHDRLHRPANFVEHALANLGGVLVLGGILVAVVLFAFLLDLRMAVISLTAIPLSLCAAVAVLEALGATLNTITIGGLAIALGEVVDDAVIDVENVLRRLRENARSAAPRPALEVVLAASVEVRGAVVYATFVVVLVFVPVLTLGGLQGRLFAPLGVAYVLAVLASLAVALTLTPALALALLPSHAARKREPRHLDSIRGAHRTVVRALARRPIVACLAALAACAAGLALVPGIERELLPDFREGHFVLHFNALPGASIAEMRRVGARLSEAILAIPHVATVEQQIGRAELGEDPWAPNRSELHVELVPCTPGEEVEVEHALRDVLACFPGMQTDVLTFLGDRIGETITGESGDVVVGVYGEDLDALDAGAATVARELASIDGAVDVQAASSVATPAMAIDLDADALAAAGLRPVDVLEEAEIANQGAVVAQAWHGDRAIDVAVTLAPEARATPEALGDLRVRAASGAFVPLASLAHVYVDSGRATIAHEGGRRRQVVTCNVEDRDPAAFRADLEARIAATALPAGTYASIGGAADAEREARRELLARAAFVLGGIALLLALALHRAANVLLVLANLPFALVGGIVALRVTGDPLSMGATIGFVTLFGITLRNSIMLVSHFEHLVLREGVEWGLDAAVRGASERFLPIAMTATITALGLVPLALHGPGAGTEIEAPMAVVILGGLASSTVLNLLVLPAAALRFGRFAPRAT